MDIGHGKVSVTEDCDNFLLLARLPFGQRQLQTAFERSRRVGMRSGQSKLTSKQSCQEDQGT